MEGENETKPPPQQESIGESLTGGRAVLTVTYPDGRVMHFQLGEPELQKKEED